LKSAGSVLSSSSVEASLVVVLLVGVVAWADKALAAASSHVDAADPYEAVEALLRRHERDGSCQRVFFPISLSSLLFFCVFAVTGYHS
jgi:hypothetical protein